MKNRFAQWAGWKLMGYPYELPFWRHIYRTGSRFYDWGDHDA